MLNHRHRVLPRHIVAIRLCHEVSTSRVATVCDECSIHLVNLVVLLLCCQLRSHLLEGGITLIVLTEGVVEYSLIV